MPWTDQQAADALRLGFGAATVKGAGKDGYNVLDPEGNVLANAKTNGEALNLAIPFQIKAAIAYLGLERDRDIQAATESGLPATVMLVMPPAENLGTEDIPTLRKLCRAVEPFYGWLSSRDQEPAEQAPQAPTPQRG